MERPEAGLVAPLAILGASCRLPGSVDSPAALRELLVGRRDAVSEIPPERWPVDEYYFDDPAPAGFSCSRWGGFLDDISGFDAAFFRITPREARRMDPQQRLLLELTWHALEDACVPASSLIGSRTAVVVGVSSHDYFQLSTSVRGQIDQYTGSGTSVAVAAGRVAFNFGFEGPALTVDTACSSSLVALHVAANMLRAGECDIAVAGGVHLMVSPVLRLIEAMIGAQSPTGRCHSFDAAADGIVSGEGGGLVVLERLSDATANRHRARATLLGTAVNQDGRSSGLTVPNGRAQAAVMSEALSRSGVSPSRVGYLEAHGSGTPLGDPIEAEAISDVYGDRNGAGPLPIGSIKTNIGHLGAAAGIAGLLKAMLVVQERVVLPQLHLDTPTPAVDWESNGLVVASEEAVLDATDGCAAAVSSFGFSGTNAHAVLCETSLDGGAAGASEAPERPRRASPGLVSTARVVVVSGAAPQALAEGVEAVRAELSSSAVSLDSVSRTTCTGRSHLAHRAAFVADDLVQLDTAMARYVASASASASAAGVPAGRPERIPAAPGSATSKTPARIAFLCPGQGGDHGESVRDLLEASDVFRESMELCDRHLRGRIGTSLVSLASGRDGAASSRSSLSQTLLVAMGYSLSVMWEEAGIRPEWVVGHSAGELTAACIAGILPLQGALDLALTRGRLQEDLTQDGAMAVVVCEGDVFNEVLAHHRPAVNIAAFNGPTRWAVSGRRDLLEKCTAELAESGAEIRTIDSITVAGHSPAMKPMRSGLREAAAALAPGSPRCRFVSTLTGRTEEPTVLRPEYWAEEVVAPVRFHQAIEAVLHDGGDSFLELGPGASLVSTLADWVPDATLLSSLRRGVPAGRHVLDVAADLFRRGAPVNWQFHCTGRPGAMVTLPGYRFQRERCWLPFDAPVFAGTSTPGSLGGDHPLLGREVSTVLSGVGQSLYEQQLSTSSPSYLGDHVVGGRAVLPAAAYVEMILAAGRNRLGGEQIRLHDVTFDRALVLGEDPVQVQTLVEEIEPGTLRVRIFSSAGRHGGWTAHCEARASLAPDAEPATTSDLTDAGAGDRTPDGDSPEYAAHHARLAAAGVSLGPAFRAMRSLRAVDGGGTAQVVLPESAGTSAGYLLHPVLLDCALQAASPSIGELGDGMVLLPARIDELTIRAAPGGEANSRATNRNASSPEGVEGEIVLDAEVRDAAGRLAAVVEGVHMRRVPHSVIRSALGAPAMRSYEVLWRESEAPPPAAFAAARCAVVLADGPISQRLVSALERRGVDVVRQVSGHVDDLVWVSEGGPGSRAESGDNEDAGRGAIASSSGFLGALDPVLVVDGEAPKVWIVTTGARMVKPSDRVEGLAHSPLWGLGHCLAREHPELRPVLVDLDPDRVDESAEWLADEICRRPHGSAGSSPAPSREPGNPVDHEDRLAFRGGDRLVERVVRTARQSGGQRLELNPDATYLVTGGVTGLGLATAEWLAERGARFLALVSRGPAEDDSLRRIDNLRASGVLVDHHRADVADSGQLAKALDVIRAKGRQLRGVFHSAGVVRDGMIGMQDDGAFRTVLDPKVRGGWFLHEATRSDPLDLFVLYSSAVVLMGPPGQGAHCAANHFLAALAHYRRAQGRPALCVDWGGWEGIGATSVHDSQQRMAAAGMGLIDRRAGFDELERLIVSNCAEAAPVPVDWDLFVERFGTSPLYHEVVSGLTEVVAGRRKIVDSIRSLPEARRLPSLVAEIREVVASCAGLASSEEVPVSAPFAEIGIDSLLAVEIRNALASSVGTPLRTTLLFDFPTVDEVAQYLAGDVLGLLEGRQVGRHGADREAPEAGAPEDLEGRSREEIDDMIDRELHAWESGRKI